MKRKIIKIDEEKCNGCGLCADACHEGAIEMVGNKAKLMRDDYCDGLGDCLPACPVNAISFEEREAAAYDAAAVNAKKQQPLPCGCPGTNSKTLIRENTQKNEAASTAYVQTQLKQWPVQIKLAPVNAPYFNDAHLLIAADCAAYAYGAFHDVFMKNKITLIGCPKLDCVDYSEKLAEILKNNSIKSVTVVRMEVPCCKGIEDAVKAALQNCGKMIQWQIKVLSTNGEILE